MGCASLETVHFIFTWIWITTTVNHVMKRVNNALAQAVLSVSNVLKDYFSLGPTFPGDVYQSAIQATIQTLIYKNVLSAQRIVLHVRKMDAMFAQQDIFLIQIPKYVQVHV